MASRSWTNWGENVKLNGDVINPGSVKEVIDIVKKYQRLIVVASGHSFVYPSNCSDVADTKEASLEKVEIDNEFGVISLTGNMNKILSMDKENMCVEVEGGITLAELAALLSEQGLALENTPSLLQVTAAGSFATATHGTGVTNCALTDMCESLTIVCGDGVVRKITDKSLFVHLGLLGVVVALSIRVVPFYSMQQTCVHNLNLDSFLPKTGEVLAAAHSVSIWIKFNQEQVIDAGEGESGADKTDTGTSSVDGAEGPVIVWMRNKREEEDSLMISNEQIEIVNGVSGKLRHDVVGINEAPDWPVHATAFGPWHDILTFFRLGSALPITDSVQTEWFVEMSHLSDALKALASIPKLSKVMAHGCEVRAVRADNFLLSPVNKRFLSNSSNSGDVFAAIHFTMQHLLEPQPSSSSSSSRPKVRPPQAEVTPEIQEAVQLIESALRPFNARPHWAKLAAAPTCTFDESQKGEENDNKGLVPSIDSSCYASIIKRWYSDAASVKFWRTMMEYDPEGKFRSKQFDQIVESVLNDVPE